MSVEGGTRVIKYLLFIFNLLFLLAGIALIIIGAIATAKLTPYSAIAGVHFNGAGVFIIIIGVIIFAISFFGCLGAYKENHCLLVTFIILMVITLLALIAAIIAAFVMRNQVKRLMTKGLDDLINEFNANSTNTLVTKFWIDTQKKFQCCGSSGTSSWKNNVDLNRTQSVPDSCCKTPTTGCGMGEAAKNSTATIYTDGCSDKLSDLIYGNVVAVGGAAAAISVLMLFGILLASCLAHGIRKHYQVV